MKDWFALTDLVALRMAHYPQTLDGWYKLARREGWNARDVQGKTEYHITGLPAPVQAALVAHFGDAPKVSPARSGDLWVGWDALPQSVRDEAMQRLSMLCRIEQLEATGWTRNAAISQVVAGSDTSVRTVYRWFGLVAGLPADDWLAALAPKRRREGIKAPCDPRAWGALKSDYLRDVEAKFATCYKRMINAAERECWGPIPSQRSLQRRIEAEVPQAVRVIKRKGKDVSKTMFPAQRRTRAGLRALELVNIDGHIFDVFVRRPGGNGAPCRPVLVAIQDVYSGMFVGWRMDETENRNAVRLAIGDMVSRYGIPDAMLLDNGRGFASKWITGGQPKRFRFKVKDDEPDGLLTLLGVNVHWTKPYSGQSKPIERAFGTLCNEISKHPFCHGAYTGNSPANKPDSYGSRALEWDEFRRFVDAMIEQHNHQQGRETETTKGGSFADAWARSIADPATVIRRASRAQRDLWLLMAAEEQIAAIQAASVGSGWMKRQDAQQAMQKLERVAREGRKARSAQPSPAQLAAMGIAVVAAPTQTQETHHV